MTVGAYAPGSSIYTFANALLDANRKVSIISLGQVSEQFGNLSKQHSELKIYTIKNAPLAERFLSLIELLNTIEPNAILIEVELLFQFFHLQFCPPYFFSGFCQCLGLIKSESRYFSLMEIILE